MLKALHAAMAAVLMIMPSAAWAAELTIETEGGTRSAALLQPAPYAATVVIVPDSLAGDASQAVRYHELADALHELGFGSLRIADPALRPGKRKRAGIQRQTSEVSAWVAAAKGATGSPCIWLLGHRSGGHAAAAAAQNSGDLCGVILVGTAPGSKEFKRAGVGPTSALPIMIVVGGKDGEVGYAQGEALQAALPGSQLAMVLGMNRALEDSASVELAPGLSERLVDTLGAFMLDKGPQVQGSLYRKPARSRGSRRAALDRGDRPS